MWMITNTMHGFNNMKFKKDKTNLSHGCILSFNQNLFSEYYLGKFYSSECSPNGRCLANESWKPFLYYCYCYYYSFLSIDLRLLWPSQSLQNCTTQTTQSNWSRAKKGNSISERRGLTALCSVSVFLCHMVRRFQGADVLLSHYRMKNTGKHKLRFVRETCIHTLLGCLETAVILFYHSSLRYISQYFSELDWVKFSHSCLLQIVGGTSAETFVG